MEYKTILKSTNHAYPLFSNCNAKSYHELFLSIQFFREALFTPEGLVNMLHNKKLVGIASFRIANSFRNGIIFSFLAIYLREQLALSVTYSNLFYTFIELFGALSQFLVWGFILDRYKRKNVLIVMGETVPALGYIGIYFLHKSLLTSSGT